MWSSLWSNNWPLILATLLYISQAWLSFSKGNAGIGTAFIFYAGANIGLIIANEGQ